MLTVANVAHLQFDQIAAPQFAVQTQVEHSQLACAVLQLQVHPDGPDILELEGCFLTNEFVLVPRLALGLIAGSFRFELLKS
jgi:hypothetical protein